MRKDTDANSDDGDSGEGRGGSHSIHRCRRQVVESGSENENGEDTSAAINESEVLADDCKILYD